MTKVSSLPLTIWHWFASHAISPVRHSLITDLVATLIHQLKKLGNRWGQSVKRQGLEIWLLALVGASLLMVWNGSLLLALSIGLAITLLIQRLPPQPISWQLISPWLLQAQSPVFIAMACGLLSFIASYITLLIWQDTQSLGLALAILFQGLGVLSVFGLCVWQIFKQHQQQLLEPTLDHWIHILTTHEPLKRLMAIRQINRLVLSTPADSSQIQDLQEYFQLLLEQETNTTIQRSIVEGLRIITDMDSCRYPPTKFEGE